MYIFDVNHLIRLSTCRFTQVQFLNFQTTLQTLGRDMYKFRGRFTVVILHHYLVQCR